MLSGYVNKRGKEKSPSMCKLLKLKGIPLIHAQRQFERFSTLIKSFLKPRETDPITTRIAKRYLSLRKSFGSMEENVLQYFPVSQPPANETHMLCEQKVKKCEVNVR